MAMTEIADPSHKNNTAAASNATLEMLALSIQIWISNIKSFSIKEIVVVFLNQKSYTVKIIMDYGKMMYHLVSFDRLLDGW